MEGGCEYRSSSDSTLPLALDVDAVHEKFAAVRREALKVPLVDRKVRELCPPIGDNVEGRIGGRARPPSTR